MFSHFQMKKKFQSCNWIETNSSSMANALALNLILFKKNEKRGKRLHNNVRKTNC